MRKVPLLEKLLECPVTIRLDNKETLQAVLLCVIYGPIAAQNPIQRLSTWISGWTRAPVALVVSRINGGEEDALINFASVVSVRPPDENDSNVSAKGGKMLPLFRIIPDWLKSVAGSNVIVHTPAGEFAGRIVRASNDGGLLSVGVRVAGEVEDFNWLNIRMIRVENRPVERVSTPPALPEPPKEDTSGDPEGDPSGSPCPASSSPPSRAAAVKAPVPAGERDEGEG